MAKIISLVPCALCRKHFPLEKFAAHVEHCIRSGKGFDEVEKRQPGFKKFMYDICEIANRPDVKLGRDS